ncbi:MAG: AraC family transcriptional regulator [Muribaculaceae bacterium]|nr:AraC family transcriptional regulator [Muribaculaceae bacterium]
MGISSKIWDTKEISPASGSPQAGRNIVVFDNINAITHLKFPVKTDFLLSIVCVEGQLKISVDVTEQILPKQSLMVLRPGHIINSYDASADFKGIFIVVTLNALNGALPSMSKFYPCVLHFLNKSIIPLSRRELNNQLNLYRLLQDKINGGEYPYKENVIQSLCEAVFYETLGLYSSHMEMESNNSIKRKDELLYQFLSLVENNFRKHRDVNYYAEKMRVSSKHLSSIVKIVSGRTAGEWIDSYVILEAKMLLRNTAMSIQEIGAALSFSDQSFFGKYFKRLTGNSPREYRSLNINTK